MMMVMMAMMRMMMMMIGIIHLGHNHFQVDQPTCFVDRAHLLIQKDHMFGINDTMVLKEATYVVGAIVGLYQEWQVLRG